VKAAPPLDQAAEQRVLLPFALTTLIWGSTWLVIHSQFGPVPTQWSVTYRFATSALTLLGVALATGVPLRIGRAGQVLALTVGLMTFAINYNFVYAAETHITSGLVAVLFALLVPVNAILGWFFLGQRLPRAFLIGSAITMLGIILLFAHELRAGATPLRETLIGIALTIGAVLCASIGNVAQGSEAAKKVPMPAMLTWAMGWGALFDGLFAWTHSGPPVFDLRPSYIAGLLYLGVVASALAFAMYFTVIRRIGPARGGYVNVLVPVIAMALSTIFENYRWSAEAALGGLLAVAGLVLAMRARSPSR
jgi:drug/metabolite transporter (DMT)-like permease